MARIPRIGVGPGYVYFIALLLAGDLETRQRVVHLGGGAWGCPGDERSVYFVYPICLGWISDVYSAGRGLF